MSQPLLLELGTEELPPLSLATLSKAFGEGILQRLNDAGIGGADQQPLQASHFATPRRLAILVDNVPACAPDQQVQKLGPNVKAAYDKEGKPSKAAQGFASGCGVGVDELTTVTTDKGERLAFVHTEPGKPITELLQTVLTEVLASLPIAKRMRWAASREEFIRPVKWLLALHGSTALSLQAFGVQSGSNSRGHRFMGAAAVTGELPVAEATDYTRLLQENFVVADYAARRAIIERQLQECGKQLGGNVVVSPELLEEVTSLVEWPHCLAGHFDDEFLQLPAEALVSSMRSHQKYFHVLDNAGELLPAFVTVANISSKQPEQVVSGNERVIRPRLADAQFFYANDCKLGLAAMAERLTSVVFQDQLGSIGDKAARLQNLAEFIAEQLGENSAVANCKRAAQLCKADLVSDMVGEFADLQGTMGRYYALQDNEAHDVAAAVEEHYLPRFAGDRLPETATGMIVGLADRLDTLVGIFGIGQAPTGSKDPFALRRAALGLLRILTERALELDLRPVIKFAIAQHGSLPEPDLDEKVLAYIIERLRGWYSEQGFSSEQIQAVLQTDSDCPLDMERRLQAVKDFTGLEQAEALAAANKRVRNILAKQQGGAGIVRPELLQEPAEKALAQQLEQFAAKVQPLLAEYRYSEALQTLAALKEPIDTFFDSVMVMDGNLELRANRIALLQQLANLFGQIADISQLPSGQG